MYDSLIGRLKKSEREHKKEFGGPTEESELLRDAANAIEELLPYKSVVERGQGLLEKAQELLDALRPRWIPVTERLPEKYKTVVCIVRDIDDEGAGSYKIGTLDNLGDWFVDDDDYSEHSNLRVTHWMQLPAPPKEETE